MIKPPTESALEAKLKRLERKYDVTAPHVRNYRNDLADIQLLLKNNKIDREHAELLAQEAKKQFDTLDAKVQVKRASEALDRKGWFARTFGA